MPAETGKIAKLALSPRGTSAYSYLINSNRYHRDGGWRVPPPVMLAPRPDGGPGVAHPGPGIQADGWKPITALTSRKSLKPCSPHSRPLPDCL